MSNMKSEYIIQPKTNTHDINHEKKHNLPKVISMRKEQQQNNTRAINKQMNDMYIKQQIDT